MSKGRATANIIPMGDWRSRDRERRGRNRVTRSKTVSVGRLAKRELERWRLLYPAVLEDGSCDPPMPKTRGECASIERPCPYVRCRFNLYLDINEWTGAIKFNFPDLEPGEMSQSCALDVAEEEGETLEAVGRMLNMTRERVRQIEGIALAKLDRYRRARLDELVENQKRTAVRRLPILENVR